MSEATSGERVGLNDSFFSGVTVRVFPLRANPSTLQDFIDRSLNYEFTRGINYFRSASSYVYLQVLSYEKLSPRREQMGYISQNEVLFSIPLYWFKRNPHGQSKYNGERYELLKYEDVSATPYVFVDNQLSVLGGRELYGWPKQLMRLENETGDWLRSPTADDTLLKVSLSLFDELFQRRRRNWKPLLEVQRKSPASDSFKMARNLVQDAERTLHDFIDWSDVSTHKQLHEAYWAKEIARQADAVEPNVAAQRVQAARGEIAIQEAWQASSPILGRKTNNIGLRQFPLSDDPFETCFRGLSNSVSRIDHISASGQLGLPGVDLSAGMKIRLYEYDQINIAQELGLLLESESDGVCTIRPVMPSWLKVDLAYTYPTDNPFPVRVHGATQQQDLTNLAELRNEFSIGLQMRGEFNS